MNNTQLSIQATILYAVKQVFNNFKFFAVVMGTLYALLFVYCISIWTCCRIIICISAALLPLLDYSFYFTRPAFSTRFFIDLAWTLVRFLKIASYVL